MKKEILLIWALISAFTTQHLAAQSNFKFKETGYVGALSADAAADWTTGWTHFDPKNAVYAAPTDTITLNGMISTLAVPGEKDITSTVILDATKTYLLKGIVVVRSGGKVGYSRRYDHPCFGRFEFNT